MGNSIIPPKAAANTADAYAAFQPAKISVTSQLSGYKIAATHDGKVKVVPFLFTGEFNTATPTLPLLLSFTDLTSGRKFTIPAISIVLDTNDQVLPLMYADKQNTGLQAGEIIVVYNSGRWTINAVPLNSSTLGFVSNSFGKKLLKGAGINYYPMINSVLFTFMSSTYSLTSSLVWISGATAPQSFSFVSVPETGFRNMLSDGKGNVYVQSGSSTSITTQALSAFKASQIQNPTLEEWGFVPTQETTEIQAKTVLLVHYKSTAGFTYLDPGSGKLKALAANVTFNQNPGLAAMYSTPSTAVFGTMKVVLTTCPAYCAAVSMYDCPNDGIFCPVAVTSVGLDACKSCQLTSTPSPPSPGPVDPYLTNSFTFLNEQVGGYVILSPGMGKILPTGATTVAQVTFPYALNLAVSTACETRLSVDPFVVSLDPSLPTQIIPIYYNAACGYQDKVYAHVFVTYDSTANTAKAVLRPYAPLTNGFVENSFGMPSPGTPSTQQGFFSGNNYTLVPGSYFQITNGSQFLSSVPSTSVTTWTSNAIIDGFTFVTYLPTKRQILNTYTLSRCNANAITSSCTLTPAGLPGNVAAGTWNAAWGVMQVYTTTSNAITTNVLMYFDGTTLYYFDTVSVKLVSIQGNIIFNNPPGFASFAAGTGALTFKLQDKYVIQTTNADNSINQFGTNACWTTTNIGCPGNAKTCRYADTATGVYNCDPLALPPNDPANKVANTNTFINTVCAKAFNASSVGCNKVAGAEVTRCSGWNSEAYGPSCKLACGMSSATAKMCDTAMEALCSKNDPALPDCACINVLTSALQIESKGFKSYPEYACYLNGLYARQVGESNIDYRPQCWWPTCSLADGAYVPTNNGSTCPSDFVQCFNLLENIDASAKSLQISAVNSSACTKGDTAFPISKTTTDCGNIAAFPANPYQLFNGSSAQPPKPAGNVYDIDKFFVNAYTPTNSIVKKYTNQVAKKNTYMDGYVIATISICSVIMFILVTLIFAATYRVAQKNAR